MYRAGETVKASNQKALELYQKGCSLGGGSGCSTLARWAYNGTAMPKSYEKAAQYYQQACDLDVARSCSNLGHMYEDGEGVVQNYAEAYGRYEKACTLGSGQGCLALGSLDVRGLPSGQPTQTSYLKAADEFSKACELKVPLACGYLGKLYQTGLGAPQSDDKAKEYFEKACNQKIGLSCFQLGLMAEYGPAGMGSYTKARDYYELACNYKDPSGCEKVAMFYENGKGVQASYDRALEYYNKAAEYSAVIQAMDQMKNNSGALLNSGTQLSEKQFSESLLKIQTDCTQLTNDLNKANSLHLFGFNIAPAFFFEGLSLSKGPGSTDENINVKIDNFDFDICSISYVKNKGFETKVNYKFLQSQYAGRIPEKWEQFLALSAKEQTEAGSAGKLVGSPQQILSAADAQPQSAPTQNKEVKEPEPEPVPTVNPNELPFKDLDAEVEKILNDTSRPLTSAQSNTAGKENLASNSNSSGPRDLDDVEWLIKAKPDLSIVPYGEIKEAFSFGNTLRRDDTYNAIKGKVVVWTLPVIEVKKADLLLSILKEPPNDNLYNLFLWKNESHERAAENTFRGNSLGVTAIITPLSDAQKEYLYNLKIHTWVTVKGYISYSDTLFPIILRPAILWDKNKDKD